MTTINIIGSGNVAQHLVRFFINSEAFLLLSVLVRNTANVTFEPLPCLIIDDYNQQPLADITIIAVSDDAIAEVSNKIIHQNTLVVHTSGAKNLDILDEKHKRGVFYPLQTFSKHKKINFKEIPICIETENPKDEGFLEHFALKISKNVYKINSEQRSKLHIAAVFVNNFTNYLYQIGNEICVENNIPFKILEPLLIETALKTQELSPKEAQTGPAKRHDLQTIKNHLEGLTNENHIKIYTLLTTMILNSTIDKGQ